jgi:hypothetical protein
VRIPETGFTLNMGEGYNWCRKSPGYEKMALTTEMRERMTEWFNGEETYF